MPRTASGRRRARHPGPSRAAAAAGRGSQADAAVAGAVVLVIVLAVGRQLHAGEWMRSHVAVLAAGAGVAVVTAALVASRLLGAERHLGRPRPRGASGTAGAPEPGWADRAELQPLLVPAPPGDRVVLGQLPYARSWQLIRRGPELVAAEGRQSVLVVGPSQCGKTTGFAVPALLEWQGPVLATSVKTDLVRQTIEARRRLGPVEVYDPTGVTGLGTGGWSPLTTSGTWTGARRTASALCSVAREEGGLDDAGFWYASAEKLLAPLLLAAATAGAAMADVVRWVDDQDLGEAMLALQLAGEPDAVRAARTSASREDRQRSSVFATAETVIAAFADPEVARSTGLPPIDPAALVSQAPGTKRLTGQGPPTLYCCAPAREQERLRPVFVALVRQAIDAAFEASSRLGHPLQPGLLVVLDEAANLAPLADLDTILATASGHGISLVTVWQDLAQVEARYGRRWPTIVNNHRAKVLCPGVADPLTLDHLSALIGEDDRLEESTTTGAEGHWSRTESTQLRRLAPAGSLRRLAPGEAVVVYGSLAPATVRLRPPRSAGSPAAPDPSHGNT